MVEVPADTPVTKPVPSIVAIVVAVLVHAPPPAASVSGVVDNAHTVAVPVITPVTASGLTVTTFVAAATPQPFVTV